MAEIKPIIRSGARFNCEQCGELLRDDDFHRRIYETPCEKCGGDLRLVAYSASRMTGDAKWFKCEKCPKLFMWRRGELVETSPRNGFDEFA